MQQDSKYVFKVCVVGEDDVGRFSILRRYLEDAITELDYFTTMESNFAVKQLEFIPAGSKESIKMKVNFWFFTEFMDTSRESDDLRHFFRNTHGVLFIFDLSRPDTLSTIPEWIETVDELTGHRTPMVLLGNKSDLEIEVDENEVKQMSDSSGAPYFYASARLNQGIDEAFDKLISMVYQHAMSM